MTGGFGAEDNFQFSTLNSQRSIAALLRVLPAGVRQKMTVVRGRQGLQGASWNFVQIAQF